MKNVLCCIVFYNSYSMAWQSRPDGMAWLGSGEWYGNGAGVYVYVCSVIKCTTYNRSNQLKTYIATCCKVPYRPNRQTA